MDGRPVAGSRTWMCTAAAPASAAARHSLAMCSGLMGRCGVWSGLVMLPVTAQVMKVFSMVFLERAAAVDDEDLPGGEGKRGRAGLDRRGDVVGKPHAFARRAPAALGVA